MLLIIQNLPFVIGSLLLVSTPGSTLRNASQGCGKDMVVIGDGEITSPGYPSNYEAGLDCWWRLTTENENDSISVEVETVRTENCCDYVEIYDGTTLKTTLRGDYLESPAYNFSSTGNSIRVFFHSDGANQMKGFKMFFSLKKHQDSQSHAQTSTTADFTSADTITTIRSTTVSSATNSEGQVSECGETDLVASDRRQTLASPGWPASEIRRLTCTWSIRAPSEALQVQLQFSHVEVLQCCDSIEIEAFDKDELVSENRIKLPSNQLFLSPAGGTLRVTYTSFGLAPSRGFRSSFVAKSEETTTMNPTTVAVPETTRTSTSRTFTSTQIPSKILPSYPTTCGRPTRRMALGKKFYLQSPRRKNASCVWTLLAPPRLRIRLTFLVFNVNRSLGNFVISGANLSRGGVQEKPFSLQLYGNKTGYVFIFDKNMGMVTYTSQSLVPKFIITYEAIPGKCQFKERAIRTLRQIRTPGFPSYLFDGAMDCTWTIQSRKPGRAIILTVKELLVSHPDDSLVVHQGREILAELRNSTNNLTLTSRSDSMTIHFTGSADSIGKGFIATYRSDKRIDDPVLPDKRPLSCGKILRKADFGFKYYLQSPASEIASCRWKFQTARGLGLRLTFKEFNVPASAGNFTLLAVPGGKFEWEKLEAVHRMSGDKTGFTYEFPKSTGGAVYYSTSNETKVTILYESYLPAENCGFRGVAFAKKRIIRTPGFPKHAYKGKLNCTWTIRRRSEDEQVQLILRDIRTDHSGDHLMIYDGPDLVTKMEFTESYEPVVTSSNGYLTIRFVGEEHDSIKGFAADYRTVKDLFSTGTTSTTAKTTAEITSALVTSAIKTASTVVPMVPATIATPLERVRCFNRVNSVFNGSTDIINQSSVLTCEPDSICVSMKIIAAARINEISVTSETSYGGCAPELLKDNYGCEQVWSTIKSFPKMDSASEMTIESCGIKFCDSDLCNDGKGISLKQVGEGTLTPAQCAVENRMDCGFAGIEKETCTNRSCCWSPSEKAEPWCFHQKDIRSECTMESEERIDCGFVAITRDECLNRGCCFDPVEEGPWCFYKGKKYDGDLQCYAITKSILTSSAITVANNKEVVTCPPGSKCLLARTSSKVIAAGFEEEVKVTYGSCVPSESCSTDLCSLLPSTLPSIGVNMTFATCNSSCCSESLCNDDSANPHIMASTMGSEQKGKKNV